MLKLEEFANKKKVLILGDAGAGKSTLAKTLGDRLNIMTYSTDDALWVTKFTNHRTREEALKIMTEIYQRDSWIVEGTTRQLLEPGIKQADAVIYLYFPTIWQQYSSLITRHFQRHNETLCNLLGLMVHVANKRFRITKKMRAEPTMLELAKSSLNLYIETFPVVIT